MTKLHSFYNHVLFVITLIVITAITTNFFVS